MQRNLGTVVVDTGPLVAALVKRDANHGWTADLLRSLPAPLITAEPVVAETMYLLRKSKVDALKVLGMIESGGLKIEFSLSDETSNVRGLMSRFRNIPMSLADACLVRMTELHPRSVVFTLDTDFRIYRRKGRQVVPTLMPQSK